MMTSLLAGMGLKHVLPVRQTPKLIFFILGNSTEKKKKHAAEGAEESTDTTATILPQAANNIADTQQGVFNWKVHVRAQLAATLKAGTLKHFTQDFSEVPPNEFAIQLSGDLVEAAL